MGKIKYLIADDGTGEIEFEFVAEEDTLATDDISANTPTGYTAYLAASLDTATFGSSIPSGTTVTVRSYLDDFENASTTVNDGSLVFSSTLSGIFFLQFTNFPYQIYEVEITAEDTT